MPKPRRASMPVVTDVPLRCAPSPSWQRGSPIPPLPGTRACRVACASVHSLRRTAWLGWDCREGLCGAGRYNRSETTVADSGGADSMLPQQFLSTSMRG